MKSDKRSSGAFEPRTRRALEIHGECHCGAVRFTVHSRPEFVVVCNCSICRRIAAKWVHAPPAKATLSVPDGATKGYSWGEKTITYFTCKTCNVTTHWHHNSEARIAVNMNLIDPRILATFRVRQFDGADTWAFLD